MSTHWSCCYHKTHYSPLVLSGPPHIAGVMSGPQLPIMLNFWVFLWGNQKVFRLDQRSSKLFQAEMKWKNAIRYFLVAKAMVSHWVCKTVGYTFPYHKEIWCHIRDSDYIIMTSYQPSLDASVVSKSKCSQKAKKPWITNLWQLQDILALFYHLPWIEPECRN